VKHSASESTGGIGTGDGRGDWSWRFSKPAGLSGKARITMLRYGLVSALRSAAASDAAAAVYCSLSRPYASTMVRRPVIRNTPKRSSERSSDSRNATSAESSETKVSVAGETFMISRSGKKVLFAPFETSNTWENAWGARCRLVCIILEKVEAGFELESERGGLRSSAGRASAKCERQIIIQSLFRSN
jgi:hypothetical protein